LITSFAVHHGSGQVLKSYGASKSRQKACIYELNGITKS